MAPVAVFAEQAGAGQQAPTGLAFPAEEAPVPAGVSVPVAVSPAEEAFPAGVASLMSAAWPVGSPVAAGQAEPGVVLLLVAAGQAERAAVPAPVSVEQEGSESAPAFAAPLAQAEPEASGLSSVLAVQSEPEPVLELAAWWALALLSVVLAAAPVPAVGECAVETAVSQTVDRASLRLSSAQIAGQLLRQRSYHV